MMKTSKKGFTLAEVLTTLMVIGVVAAMTIPTLMNNTNGQQNRVAYKKAMSVLGQGVQLLVARDESCTVSTSAQLATCMNRVMAGTITSSMTGSAGSVNNILITPDGIAYKFIYKAAATGTPTGAETSNRSLTDICGSAQNLFLNTQDSWAAANARCLVIVDVNGVKSPSNTFVATDPTLGSALTSANVSTGMDQIPIFLTGDAVRPLYAQGEASTDSTQGTVATAINSGYEAMYGEGTKPVY